MIGRLAKLHNRFGKLHQGHMDLCNLESALCLCLDTLSGLDIPFIPFCYLVNYLTNIVKSNQIYTTRNSSYNIDHIPTFL